MSDIMLHGVLRMPPELWSNDELDKMQRHSRYLQASRVIEEQEQRIAELERSLAAAQATIAAKDEALAKLESIAGTGSNAKEIAQQALALQADRTALDAMLKEAEKRGMQRAERICRNRSEDRFNEHGTREPDTGACYYTGSYADEYDIRDEEDEDCANAIRQAAERSE